ncbi:MAG: VOC family protein [Thermodesulfobacteriota bacterium]
MEVNRIDHISIAVRDLNGARSAWEPVLGKSGPDELYVHEPESIRVARYWVGGVALELMESTTPDGPVAMWIEAHGEGIMVLSLNVENTKKAMEELEPMGYPFVPSKTGDKLRPFRGCQFAFIHPGKLNGVLLEIIDEKKGGHGLGSANL